VIVPGWIEVTAGGCTPPLRNEPRIQMRSRSVRNFRVSCAIRLWRYRRETSSRRNGALIILTRTDGSTYLRAGAIGGRVDQTREEGRRVDQLVGSIGKR
jgi:hypothetical protein